MIYVQCGFTGLTVNVEGRSRLCKWGLPLIWRGALHKQPETVSSSSKHVGRTAFAWKGRAY